MLYIKPSEVSNMVIASGKLKDRLYIDLPDIKAESDKLDHLIENHSLSEA